MIRIKQFLPLIIRFFTVICFAVSLSAPAQAHSCGYSCVQSAVASALDKLIDYLGGGHYDKWSQFITGEFDRLDQAQAERDQLSAHGTQLAANTVVHGMDAAETVAQMRARQQAQTDVAVAEIGEVEGACIAMSRMQNFSSARFHSIYVEEEVAGLVEDVNAGTRGMPGATGGPLEYHNQMLETWRPFLSDEAMGGGAILLASNAGESSLKKKVSLTAQPGMQGPGSDQTPMYHAVNATTASEENKNLDVSPIRLANQLSIEMTGEVKDAFVALIQHLTGGPTPAIPASILENRSSSAGQILGEWRAFSSFQNLGAVPFVTALSQRMVTPGSPTDVTPVFDAMMDEYGFPDDLRERYKAGEAYSYAAMRDLIGFLPMFNPKEFAEKSLIGDSNVFNQTLLYQGYTTAFILEVVEQLEVTNMLLGAMLLRDMNDDSRPDLQRAIQRLGSSAGVSYDGPSLDADEREMDRFINAAIEGTEATMQAIPVSAPIQ